MCRSEEGPPSFSFSLENVLEHSVAHFLIFRKGTKYVVKEVVRTPTIPLPSPCPYCLSTSPACSKAHQRATCIQDLLPTPNLEF